MTKKENSHGREAILMHRLCFDLQLAAARSGYYLNTYYDDVDQDGFDLIFDDQDTIKKTQVKTVDLEAGTDHWDIHKRILRPSFEHITKIGFESSPVGEGVEGGFILMQFDTAARNVAVRYFYTDLYVWLAFECGAIRRRDGRSQAAVKRCLRDLLTGLGNERVRVPWALMLEAKSPDALLALSGLHGPAEFTWIHHVFLIANNVRAYAEPKMKMPLPLSDMKRMAADGIRELAADADLVDGEP
jgi:hypothetical protein